MKETAHLNLEATSRASVIFASDLHLTPHSLPMYTRVVRWLHNQIERNPPALTIFGGDLLQSNTAALPRLLRELGHSARRAFWLEGNRDPGIGTALGEQAIVPRSAAIRGSRSLTETHAVVLLDSKHSRLSQDDLRLIRAVPNHTHLLVATHVPLDHLDPACRQSLARIAQNRTAASCWVCGHVHTDGDTDQQGWQVLSTRGLDPCRAAGGRPAYLRIQTEASGFAFHTHEMPSDTLRGNAHRSLRLGLACKDDLHRVVTTAITHDIDAIQLYSDHFDRSSTQKIVELIDTWQQQATHPFLSIHLPNPDFASARATDRLWGIMKQARSLDVQDFTVHLPKGPASRFIDSQGRWRDTDQLAGYQRLAEIVLARDASLSLENIHNPPNQTPTQEDLLSTRPEHLLLFIEELRRAWRHTNPVHPAQAERIAAIFDVGHARNNGRVGKQLAPVDWIKPLQALIQTLHVHQVLPLAGRLRNHQPITDACGPLINYVGVLHGLIESRGPDCVAFVEVREIAGALASWRTLEQTLEQMTASASPRDAVSLPSSPPLSIAPLREF